MPFPEISRVIYSNNPLDQVICQYQFPPILKIDAEIPALFQDKIRSQFPIYSETSNIINLPNIPDQPIPKELIDQIQKTRTNYEFVSEDGIWKVNLTRTFIALTCNKYTRWEIFKEKLTVPFNALNEIYAPLFFTRIGLRYIDVIRRSALNLVDTEWSELLQPYILGLLSLTDLSSRVQSLDNNYEILLSDEKSRVKLMTKYVKYIINNELCFMIDSDFFTNERIQPSDAVSKIDFFNQRASRLIRWCITDKLHTAMEPSAI